MNSKEENSSKTFFCGFRPEFGLCCNILTSKNKIKITIFLRRVLLWKKRFNYFQQHLHCVCTCMQLYRHCRSYLDLCAEIYGTGNNIKCVLSTLLLDKKIRKDMMTRDYLFQYQHWLQSFNRVSIKEARKWLQLGPQNIKIFIYKIKDICKVSYNNIVNRNGKLVT